LSQIKRGDMGKEVNAALIKQCQDRALRMMSPNEVTDFRNRKTVTNNEFLMEEIQSEFQGAAYTYYLASRIGLTEFKVCLFFNTISQQNMLFDMLETKADHITRNILMDLTKLKISDKQLNNIVEFYFEYRSWKNHKEGTH